MKISFQNFLKIGLTIAGQPGDQDEPGPIGQIGPMGIPGAVGRTGLQGFPGQNLVGAKGERR